MSETHAAALARGAARLAETGVENAARDAELLMRWAANLSGAALSARLSDPATPEMLIRFEDGLNRRAAA